MIMKSCSRNRMKPALSKVGAAGGKKISVGGVLSGPPDGVPLLPGITQ